MQDKTIECCYLGIIACLLLIIFLFLVAIILHEKPVNIIKNLSIEGIPKGNLTYYYNITADKLDDKITIKINNACIYLMDAQGESMKPFFSNHTLLVLDLCYPVEKLKIGDIIVFRPQFLNHSVDHRIIDINYEKRYVITKGDNNLTNPTQDDFYSFDDIEGKNIGFLNVYDDIINESGAIQ